MVTSSIREEAKEKPAKTHPSGDNRFKMLEAAMKRNQYQPDALIEVLHTAQQLFGYLEEDLLIHIAHSLKVPPSRVFGVATFYHFFALKPQGEHTCVVCLGTACYVKGSNAILLELEKTLGIKPGETTPDGKVSLMSARCIGACGIAPAVTYDGSIAPVQTAGTAVDRVKGWIENGS